MKVKEIVAEMQNKKIAGGPMLTSIDKSVPWIRRGVDVAATRTRTVNKLSTAKEKFDYVYKIANQSNRISVMVKTEDEQQVSKRSPIGHYPPRTTATVPAKYRKMTIVNYDPASGDITLKTASGFGVPSLYTGNINDAVYNGRSKTVTNTKTYKFSLPNAEYVGDADRAPKPAPAPSAQEKRWADKAAEEEKMKYNAFGSRIK